MNILVIGANGYPDLRVDSVLGCPEEGIDVQMLLDPFEEKLNLPAFAVQFRNSQRVFNRKVVGQEVIDFPRLKVLIRNESECIGILPCGVISGKADGLVGENTGAFVNRSVLNDLVGHVVPGAGDEVSPLLMKVLVKLLKSYISLVQQVESTGFDRNLVHHFGIIDLAWTEQNKGGNRASQVHECVHLEGTFDVMELRSGAQLQIRFDGATIERIYHLFKTNPQLFILVKRRNFLNKSHRKVLIDTPILLLVDFRKCRFGHHLDAGSIEVSAEVKCSLNISHIRTVDELRKAHHHELATAIECDGVTVSLVAVDTLLELIFISERHNLCEDCFSFVHGLRVAS